MSKLRTAIGQWRVMVLPVPRSQVKPYQAWPCVDWRTRHSARKNARAIHSSWGPYCGYKTKVVRVCVTEE